MLAQKRIEAILAKHGVEQSKELSLALEEILRVFSKDSDLASDVSKHINRAAKQSNRLRGNR